MRSKRLFVKRLLGIIGKDRRHMVLSIIAAIFASAIGMLIPLLAGRAIDCISTDMSSADYSSLYTLIALMCGLIILASILQLVFSRLNNKITYFTTDVIRKEAYGKIKRLPISYIDKTSSGMLQSMIISDCETVGDGILMFLNQFFTGIVAIAITLSIMIYIDYKIALFVLIFTPVSFIVSYLIASSSSASFKRQAEIRSRQTSYISEIAGNFRTVHAFKTEENICRKFDRINEKYRKTATRASFLSSITNPSTRFVNGLIYAGVAYIGAMAVVKNNLTVGALSSLLAYANQFMKPFNDLSSVYTELSDSFACLGRIFNFLDEEELNQEETEDENPWDAHDDFVIEFRNVSFSYVPGKEILHNVSFVVRAGTSCAIVGPTGCGKTTVINLLMRFYEPDSGEILVNDVNIKDIPRDVLRKYIGVVTQDTWFRNGIIMDNIKYGDPDMSDASAIDTAKISGADSFIRKLPQKYNEKINSNRDDISEGQRQLLSITRAMACDPSMLILDEATSSVDILTEVKIQKAVKELLNGRTSIIIAHRLSTIIDADQIVVMENGNISEIGRHVDLIKNDGFYSKLYKSYRS
ncbi:MAG: ABC transporter ATP-binding protein/permease [Saccharofermentans sp.]|nr:ABC transporter ATP-binding protein/permease [Saccharofermentans sp.]